MFKKTMKKLACGVLAVASVVACAGTFTACETSNPEVKMQIEFNGETYNLNYKLYRKIAPTTVEHFLYLADNGYYDGLCVHDYDADNLKMYTGGYSVATDETDTDGLVYKSYYDAIAAFDNYGKFPMSVWRNEDKKNPTYTLYGEFKNNNFEVKNGALKESFGSLTMYYHDIASYAASENTVYVSRADGNTELASRQYKYNSATSLFYISLLDGEQENQGYCTFATLKSGSVKVLEDLQADIKAYIETNYTDTTDDEDDFTTLRSVRVNTDDPFVGENTINKSFHVPNAPIVIKKVEVKKF